MEFLSIVIVFAGRIRSIDIKRSRDGRGGAFAFVDYDHPRDASDAVYERDGYSFDGGRLRVELAKGSRERDRDRDGGRGRGPRGAGFRVRISGLPSSASWQVRKHAPPTYMQQITVTTVYV